MGAAGYRSRPARMFVSETILGASGGLAARSILRRRREWTWSLLHFGLRLCWPPCPSAPSAGTISWGHQLGAIGVGDYSSLHHSGRR